MIKAIFFDLDGTLSNTLPIHINAWQEAIKEITGHTLHHDEIVPIIDLSMDDKIDNFLKNDIITKEQIHQVCDLKEKYAIKNLKKVFVPNKVHQVLFIKLKQMGYKIGLCSNANRTVVDLFRTLSGLEDYFDVVLSRGDVQHGKPDPEIYTKACARVGVEPRLSLAFEDSSYGAESALKAGLKCVKVASPRDIKSSYVFENIVRMNLT